MTPKEIIDQINQLLKKSNAQQLELIYDVIRVVLK